MKGLSIVWILALLIIIVFLNQPIYKYIYHYNFKNDDEYDKNIKRVFTPNFLQNSKDNNDRDFSGESRATIYAFLCIAITILEWLALFSVLRPYLS